MNEVEIFNKKSFKDLIQDIYENSSEKKDQIQSLISQLVSLIKRTEDVVLIGPVVKDLLDVSVKNDDKLVKLGSVVIMTLQILNFAFQVPWELVILPFFLLSHLLPLQ